MADEKKFLDQTGLGHFVDTVIGKTADHDISGIGDGTLKGAICDVKESLGTVLGDTVTNLLKPTLQSQVIAGSTISVTANGDGTYTLNGKASDSDNSYVFVIPYGTSLSVKTGLKFLGCPSGSSEDTYFMQVQTNGSWKNVYEDGLIIDSNTIQGISIVVKKGKTINATFKPMLTSNTKATFTDYVPFTGSTGKLNSDVAGLQVANNTLVNKVNNLYIPHCNDAIESGKSIQISYSSHIGLSLIALQGGQGFAIFMHPYTTDGNIINLSGNSISIEKDATNQIFTLKNSHSWARAYVYFISQ